MPTVAGRYAEAQGRILASLEAGEVPTLGAVEGYVGAVLDKLTEEFAGAPPEVLEHVLGRLTAADRPTSGVVEGLVGFANAVRRAVGVGRLDVPKHVEWIKGAFGMSESAVEDVQAAHAEKRPPRGLHSIYDELNTLKGLANNVWLVEADGLIQDLLLLARVIANLDARRPAHEGTGFHAEHIREVIGHYHHEMRGWYGEVTRARAGEAHATARGQVESFLTRLGLGLAAQRWRMLVKFSFLRTPAEQQGPILNAVQGVGNLARDVVEGRKTLREAREAKDALLDPLIAQYAPPVLPDPVVLKRELDEYKRKILPKSDSELKAEDAGLEREEQKLDEMIYSRVKAAHLVSYDLLGRKLEIIAWRTAIAEEMRHRPEAVPPPPPPPAPPPVPPPVPEVQKRLRDIDEGLKRYEDDIAKGKPYTRSEAIKARTTLGLMGQDLLRLEAKGEIDRPTANELKDRIRRVLGKIPLPPRVTGRGAVRYVRGPSVTPRIPGTGATV